MILVYLLVAGKLADGWRGHSYGQEMSTPPSPSCTQPSEEGALWKCPEDIGGTEYAVYYTGEGKTYYGINIECDSYTSCNSLKGVLDAAWGDCDPTTTLVYGGLPAECSWADGAVGALWRFNGYSNKGSATALHIPSYRQFKAEKEAAAKAAASEL